LNVPLISPRPLNLSIWNEARIRAFVQARIREAVMSHQEHSIHPHRLLDVAPLPSRSQHHHRARRGSGTILSFAVTFAFVLGVTLSGLGLPTPVNPLTQTSDQR
jgi:hypothetical protein